MELTANALVDALVASYDPERPPAPYPAGRFPQDDLEGLGGPGEAPNSPREALAIGLSMVQDRTYVGVGYCLKVIRSLYGVAPLYPDATTAWQEAEHKHRTDDPDNLHALTPIWWTNDGHGHVAFDLRRDGLCLTTDYTESGRLGIAPIAALGPWCGGTLRGWTEDLNGVRVWAPRDPFDKADKVQLVRRALERARANDRPEGYVNGLRDWLRNLEGK